MLRRAGLLRHQTPPSPGSTVAAAAPKRTVIATHPVIARLFPHLPFVVSRDDEDAVAAASPESDATQKAASVEMLFSSSQMSFASWWPLHHGQAFGDRAEQLAADRMRSERSIDVMHAVDRFATPHPGDEHSAKKTTAAANEDEADAKADDDNESDAVGAQIAHLQERLVNSGSTRAAKRGAVEPSEAEPGRVGTRKGIIDQCVNLRDHEACRMAQRLHAFDPIGAAEMLRLWLGEGASRFGRWPTGIGLYRSPMALYGYQVGAMHSPALLKEWSAHIALKVPESAAMRENWCPGVERDGVVPFEPNPLTKWVIAVGIVEQRVLRESFNSAKAFTGHRRASRRLAGSFIKRKRRDENDGGRSADGTTTRDVKPAAGKVSLNVTPQHKFVEELTRQVFDALTIADPHAARKAPALVRAVLPMVLEQQLPTAAKSKALPGQTFSIWWRVWCRYLSTERRGDRQKRADEVGDDQIKAAVREELAAERRLKQTKASSGTSWSASQREHERRRDYRKEFERRLGERKMALDPIRRSTNAVIEGLYEPAMPPAAIAFLLHVCEVEAERMHVRPDDVDRASVLEFATEIMRHHTRHVYEAHFGRTRFDPEHPDASSFHAPYRPRFALLLQYLGVLSRCGDVSVVSALAEDVVPSSILAMNKRLAIVAKRALMKQHLLPPPPAGAGHDSFGLAVDSPQTAVQAVEFVTRLRTSWGVPKTAKAFVVFREEITGLLAGGLYVGNRLSMAPAEMVVSAAADISVPMPDGTVATMSLAEFVGAKSTVAKEGIAELRARLRAVYRDAVNPDSATTTDAEQAAPVNIDAVFEILSQNPLVAMLQLLATTVHDKTPRGNLVYCAAAAIETVKRGSDVVGLHRGVGEAVIASAFIAFWKTLRKTSPRSVRSFFERGLVLATEVRSVALLNALLPAMGRGYTISALTVAAVSRLLCEEMAACTLPSLQGGWRANDVHPLVVAATGFVDAAMSQSRWEVHVKTIPELRQLLCCLAVARPWVASTAQLAREPIVELPVAPRPREASSVTAASGTDDVTITAGVSAHDEFVKRLRGEIAVIDADRQQQHGDDQRARLPRVVSLRDSDSAIGKRRLLNGRQKALGSSAKLRGAKETDRLARVFVHREPADMPRFKNPTASSK